MVMELLLFTLVLSIDSFSAALALGFRHFSSKRALFFALSSGFSEGFATAILLCLVGGHICYHAFQDMQSDVAPQDKVKVHGLWKILFVSTVTSIDSLGVGISLGLFNKPIALYSLCIGIGAFLSTYLGLFLAKKISGQLGEKIEFMGGIVLILIGVKMLSI
jgi:manganese efflux pump family protein